MATFASAPGGELHEDRGSVLYIGALYDAYPLTLPEIRQSHSTIIFTDAMPGNGYYKNIKTEAEILQILREEGGNLAITSEFYQNPQDGSWECTLKDDCKLKYFFNVVDLDPSRLPEVLLSSVKTLWIHGYDPQGPIVELLPNVGMVFASPSSMGEAYWAARQRMGTVEGDALAEFNIRCAIPDVICWHSERGFDLRGEEGMDERLMVCDAPFQFTAAPEEEEDEDEDEYENEQQQG